MTSDILNYIEWRGDLPFDVAPLNEVDMAIFSELTYLDLNGIVPDFFSLKWISIKEISDKFFNMDKRSEKPVGLIIPNTMVKMLKMLSESERFKNVLVSNYVNNLNVKEERQFCALTFRLTKKIDCVAFSGTDDTIIGWKENFNMIYKYPISSQIQAVDYVNKTSNYFAKNIYLCGHSKGGNLAVYAGLMASDKIKKRIVKVYNFDGPGFDKDMADKLDSYEYKKVIEYIPQGSVVGRLFDHKESAKIIKSDGIGFNQHDMFLWKINKTRFVESEAEPESLAIDKTVKEIVKELSFEDRELVVEGFYKLLSSANTQTLIDMSAKWGELVKCYLFMEPKYKKVLNLVTAKLFKERALKSYFFGTIKDFNQRQKQEKTDKK